jgi:hypothetical protein
MYMKFEEPGVLPSLSLTELFLIFLCIFIWDSLVRLGYARQALAHIMFLLNLQLLFIKSFQNQSQGIQVFILRPQAIITSPRKWPTSNLPA